MLGRSGPGSCSWPQHLGPAWAAMSSGRAGGQSGLRAKWCWTPAEAIFRLMGFGICGDSRLLLDDNYNRKITNITAETQSTRRKNERRRRLLKGNALFECGCCRRSGPGCCSWPLPLGSPGLLRGRQGGKEAGRAEITGSREGAKPRSSDERRTFLPNKGPRASSV